MEIDKIIENAKIRKLINENAELTLDEKINLIRPIIFREECDKILNNDISIYSKFYSFRQLFQY